MKWNSFTKCEDTFVFTVPAARTDPVIDCHWVVNHFEKCVTFNQSSCSQRCQRELSGVSRKQMFDVAWWKNCVTSVFKEHPEHWFTVINRGRGGVRGASWEAVRGRKTSRGGDSQMWQGKGRDCESESRRQSRFGSHEERRIWWQVRAVSCSLSHTNSSLSRSIHALLVF